MRILKRTSLMALTLWMLASPSAAGTLAIDFAFDQGQAGFGTFFPVVSFANATSFSGTARIVLTGVDSLGAITAPMPTAALQGLSLQLSFSASSPPTPAVESAQFSQVSAAAGTFDGTTLRLPARAFSFQARLPPLTGPGVFASSEAVLDLFALNRPGAAQLLLRAGGTAGSTSLLLLTFDVEGREVARTFSAPEVPEMGLLGIGLLLLGAQVARRRTSRIADARAIAGRGGAGERRTYGRCLASSSVSRTTRRYLATS